MKKLLKIFTLVLSLIAMLTAFTVVALASEEEAPAKAAPISKEIFNVDLDTTHGVGDLYLGSNNTGKFGKWIIGQSDNGNKYLIGMYDTGTANGENIEEPNLPGTTYGFGTHPTVALDFDFLTTTGELNSNASVRFDLYVKRLVNGSYRYNRLSMMTSLRLNSTGMNVANTPNVWQHVTCVVQHVGNGVFNYYFYVDGRLSGTAKLDFNTTKFSGFQNAYSLADSTTWNELFANNPSISLDNIGIYNTVIIPPWSAKTSPDEQFWYDNMRVSYYTADYSLDEVASYVYNETYEMPYGFTEATIGDAVYDDVNKAVNAATEGQTVKLTKNADTTLVIDKNIFVDTNVYDENGTATGSFYTFEYSSSQGFVSKETEEGSGIYGFAPSSTKVEVLWDVPCSEECNCYEEFGGHRLTATTIALLGNTPEFFGTIPTYDIVDGQAKEFAGWSYTKGSDTADTLLPVTYEDIAAGSITLYPVYKAIQYSFSITKLPNTTYYMESEFATALNAAASGSTVTLYTDVTFNHTILFKSTGRTLTLDLNGYKLMREYYTYVQFNAVYDENTGKYVKDGSEIGRIDTGRDTTEITSYSNGTKAYSNGVFGFAKGGNVTLKSSRPGAELHAYYMSVEELMVDGEVVAYQNSYLNKGLTLFHFSPAPGSNINIDGENITFYTGTLFEGEHGSNSASTTININGGTFYTVGSTLTDGVFGVRRGETVNVKDASFYCNGKMLSYTNYNKGTTYTFDNCNIYDFIIKAKYDAENYTFINCNLVNPNYSYNETVIIGEGTAVTSDAAKYNILPGNVYTNNTDKTYSYSKLIAAAVYDAESGRFVPDMTFDEAITGSFAYEVKKCSEAPESITDARLAILYYTDFNMVLYIPVTEGMAINSLTNFESVEDTVKIGGKDYYVYKRACTTAGASDAVKAIAQYTVNGKDYKQTFEVSALIYADLLLKDSEEATEIGAVANMVRYIKETRLASALEAGEAFDSLIALGNIADLGDSDAYADETVNYAALSGYVQSIKFMLDGNNAAYVITLTENAISAGATVSVSYLGGDSITLKNSATTANAKYTSDTRVYDIATNAIEITVTVPGDEPTVITGAYSVKAFINATNNTLVKAMYEFATSIKAYREYLIENT